MPIRLFAMYKNICVDKAIRDIQKYPCVDLDHRLKSTNADLF